MNTMSNRFLWMMIAVLIVAVLVGGCSAMQKPLPQAVQPVELNISAAASLKEALTEIQKNYQTKNPNVKLNYNLGGSGDLQKQIEQGVPADIFISAAPKEMDELEAKGLVNKTTRKNLVGNQLVLIVPQNSTLGLTKYEDLAKPNVKQIGIGDPATVPAGQYAQEVFQTLGIWDDVKPKTVPEKDVRAVLTNVETGNLETGIVYKTDASSSDKVKIIETATEESHQPIVYPVAVLTGAKQQKAAEDFLAYLDDPASKSVFEKYGFILLK